MLDEASEWKARALAAEAKVAAVDEAIERVEALAKVQDMNKAQYNQFIKLLKLLAAIQAELASIEDAIAGLDRLRLGERDEALDSPRIDPCRRTLDHHVLAPRARGGCLPEYP